MKICFYAPFKPLDHPNPSGDLIIARGLYDFLKKRGHALKVPSSLRCRWIYRKPWKWFSVIREQRRTQRLLDIFEPNLWLTYHTYYKAPDMLGPYVTSPKKIPYVLFQAIYSTKRRRQPGTLPGFLLNRKALLQADHIFTNRQEDERNLRRIIAPDRITYVAPGIFPHQFQFDSKARSNLRRFWEVGDSPVVLSAAMFRPDVKTEGLEWVIRACGEIFRKGTGLFLVIAGDGKEKYYLKNLAERYLPNRVIFAGKISRDQMYQFYSAGDLFVFPGIRESLGMVFLEAQSCGLPVVAFNTGGIPEVVRHNDTGILTPLLLKEPFTDAIKKLLTDRQLLKEMGKKARLHVNEKHDLDKNYFKVDQVLRKICQKSQQV